MEDIYNRERRTLGIKRKFKETCPDCFDLMEKFEHTLRLNNYSIGRIEKYWSFLKTIHIKLGKCFDDVRKADIENFIITVDSNPKWSNWTKSDFKKILKFFYRWLADGSIEGDYPNLVRWIKTRTKKSSSKTPEEILLKQEIEQMADQCSNPRNRALILILYESGCRISELLNTRIKDVNFDQFGCYMMVSGKTGWRRVRIIDYSKDLLNWLDSHPFKNNHESFVWINLENPNPETRITPFSVNILLKSMAKKCNIVKPVHAHAFRHARATCLAKQLPEAVMKQMFGWTNDSRMASIYFHLSGKDVDEALLKLHGIKTEEIKEEKTGMRICKVCGTNNSILSHFCKKCNLPLDSSLIIDFDDSRRKFDEFVRDFLVYYSNKDRNFKKAFFGFVEERNAEKLFLIDKFRKNI